MNTIKILLALLVTVIMFHIAIIIKIIPYSIAWGGRLKNDAEMYVFETLSILINVFLIWILFMKGNFVKFRFSNRTINIILWIFFSIFLLNSIGNIFAKTYFEKFFAIVTVVFAILLWRIIMQNKKQGAYTK